MQNDQNNISEPRSRKALFIGGGLLLAALFGYGIWKYSARSTPGDLATEAMSIEVDQTLPTDAASGATAETVAATAPAPANKAEEKALAERAEIVKDKIKKSPYVAAIKPSDSGGSELDCEAILRDYEIEIDKSVQSKKISDKLRNVANDPLLVKCQSDPEFKRRFMEIYNRLDNM